jgi:hypothetical protein
MLSKIHSNIIDFVKSSLTDVHLRLKLVVPGRGRGAQLLCGFTLVDVIVSSRFLCTPLGFSLGLGVFGETP